MSAPADPGEFVAAAERATNDRDLESATAVYSDDVLLQTLTDGAIETFRGTGEARRAWTGYLAAMEERGFRLAKTLVATSEEVIVNEWTGTLGGRTESRGIEYWVFDDAGKVREHRLYNFLNVKPSTSTLQRLRLGLAYPRTAVSFLRAQRRSRG